MSSLLLKLANSHFDILAKEHSTALGFQWGKHFALISFLLSAQKMWHIDEIFVSSSVVSFELKRAGQKTEKHLFNFRVDKTKLYNIELHSEHNPNETDSNFCYNFMEKRFRKIKCSEPTLVENILQIPNIDRIIMEIWLQLNSGYMNSLQKNFKHFSGISTDFISKIDKLLPSNNGKEKDSILIMFLRGTFFGVENSQTRVSSSDQTLIITNIPFPKSKHEFFRFVFSTDDLTTDTVNDIITCEKSQNQTKVNLDSDYNTLVTSFQRKKDSNNYHVTTTTAKCWQTIPQILTSNKNSVDDVYFVKNSIRNFLWLVDDVLLKAGNFKTFLLGQLTISPANKPIWATIQNFSPISMAIRVEHPKQGTCFDLKIQKTQLGHEYRGFDVENCPAKTNTCNKSDFMCERTEYNLTRINSNRKNVIQWQLTNQPAHVVEDFLVTFQKLGLTTHDPKETAQIFHAAMTGNWPIEKISSSCTHDLFYVHGGSFQFLVNFQERNWEIVEQAFTKIILKYDMKHFEYIQVTNSESDSEERYNVKTVTVENRNITKLCTLQQGCTVKCSPTNYHNQIDCYANIKPYEHELTVIHYLSFQDHMKEAKLDKLFENLTRSVEDWRSNSNDTMTIKAYVDRKTFETNSLRSWRVNRSNTLMTTNMHFCNKSFEIWLFNTLAKVKNFTSQKSIKLATVEHYQIVDIHNKWYKIENVNRNPIDLSIVTKETKFMPYYQGYFSVFDQIKRKYRHRLSTYNLITVGQDSTKIQGTPADDAFLLGETGKYDQLKTLVTNGGRDALFFNETASNDDTFSVSCDRNLLNVANNSNQHLLYTATNVQFVTGRYEKVENAELCCLIRSVDLRGGKNATDRDTIFLPPHFRCHRTQRIFLSSHTSVVNKASQGTFYYHVKAEATDTQVAITKRSSSGLPKKTLHIFVVPRRLDDIWRIERDDSATNLTTTTWRLAAHKIDLTLTLTSAPLDPFDDIVRMHFLDGFTIILTFSGRILTKNGQLSLQRNLINHYGAISQKLEKFLVHKDDVGNSTVVATYFKPHNIEIKHDENCDLTTENDNQHHLVALKPDPSHSQWIFVGSNTTFVKVNSECNQTEKPACHFEPIYIKPPDNTNHNLLVLDMSQLCWFVKNFRLQLQLAVNLAGNDYVVHVTVFNSSDTRNLKTSNQSIGTITILNPVTATDVYFDLESMLVLKMYETMALWQPVPQFIGPNVETMVLQPESSVWPLWFLLDGREIRHLSCLRYHKTVFVLGYSKTIDECRFCSHVILCMFHAYFEYPHAFPRVVFTNGDREWRIVK